MPKRLANSFLLLASIAFYAWGEHKFVVIMLGSIVVNWAFGLALETRGGKLSGKVLIAAMVFFNLAILFTYKYLGFVEDNVERFFGVGLGLPKFALPVGISFYTFQAMSYAIDVYRKVAPVQKNPLNTALYIMMFPQIVAGPIVRYGDIAAQLKVKERSIDNFSYGLRRFIFGLSKKLILANTFAIYADSIFGTAYTIGTFEAWIGIVAYTLQIYFDFSGYSDMAIGLGAMLGFKFKENFNYPYMASSVTDFWRRWHISLGAWFRDYVYFPLGGSRVKTKSRLVFNLFVVWTLTGIWHGARWQFVAWGMLYFGLLTFEKLLSIPQRIEASESRFFPMIYRVCTLLAVMCGWVIFRANGLRAGLKYVQSMFIPHADVSNISIGFLCLIVIGVFAATPAMKSCFIKNGDETGAAGLAAQYAGLLLLFTVCVMLIISGGYNPFIYFNF
ncbi:MAG: MBOAT family protein [Clostridiales Family XIII bacterium]|nr:MBOAT family protein [Clostridiales Family XIII bacterium]